MVATERTHATQLSSQSTCGFHVTRCPLVTGSPYQQLLDDALTDAGADVTAVHRPTIRWALRAAPESNILHLHWLDVIIGAHSQRPQGPVCALRQLLAQMVRAVSLVICVWLARTRNVRVVWTVHNLMPHDRPHRWLHRLLRRRIAKMASTVTTHSQHAAALVEATFGRPDVVVAYHPSFIGYYPPPRRTRLLTREQLGIPASAYVVLAFGMIREYKRVPALIQAFRSVSDPDARLLVVGRVWSDDLRRRVEAAAEPDRRVILRLGFVDDDDVEEIHRAADIAVLGYDDIFSSGALMLALSASLPVVVPAGSTAVELGGPPAILPFKRGQLGVTLADVVAARATCGHEALDAARRHTWDHLAEVVLCTLPG